MKSLYFIRYLKLLVLTGIASFMFLGCASIMNPEKTNAEFISDRKKANKETLAMLYKHAPKAKEFIARSYGYATFNNIGVNVLFISAEGGTGIAHNNKTGENIYMNMGSGGIGLGLGIKDFRAVFVFKNKKAFDTFVNEGWEANAQADAAIKSGDKGAAVGGAITVQPGVVLYKLTKNGLALQVTIQGTKFWKDTDLN